jgi:hypothetical protein
MQYEQKAYEELSEWRKKMLKDPSALNLLSKKVQNKLNSYIPEKIHKAITAAIKQMVRGVLFGASFATRPPAKIISLEKTETEAKKLIKNYRKTGAVEGGITGAGGILMGVADFPILLGIKLKLLFDLAAVYGYDVKDYKERVFMLHIFQLAFSSQEHRRNIFLVVDHWQEKQTELPENINELEWRSFQQEYRDYIDLVKMAQLIPGIGAAVGLVANYQLIDTLGKTAMNCYRLRMFDHKRLSS